MADVDRRRATPHPTSRSDARPARRRLRLVGRFFVTVRLIHPARNRLPRDFIG